MRRLILSAAAATTLGLMFTAMPGPATAHPASIVCDPVDGWVVQAQPYRGAVVTNSLFNEPAGTVRLLWSDGFQATLRLPGACPTPTPTPTPTPVPPAPEVSPPPPPRVVTCAEALAAYPKSGPKRRAAWGCPANPSKKPTVKPHPNPRVVTCSFILSHYRGAARARMIVRHRLPATCGHPFNPPVAG